MALNESKILNRLTQAEAYANLFLREVSMLRLELSGVVSDNSTRKGKKLSPEITAKILGKREKSRSRGR